METRSLPSIDLKSEKLISHKHRFIWVGVPKAATRSILTLLHRDPPQDFGTQQVGEELRWILKADERLRDYFMFTFVRNPWSRVVSTYFNKIVTEKEDVREHFLSRYDGLFKDMSFEEFVRFLMDDPGGADIHSDRHWASQHLFLLDEKGKIPVNFIGRVENLAEDFNKVTKALGLGEFELPSLNTRAGWNNREGGLSARDPKEYQKHYTPETRELVAKRYAVDIKVFGYTF